MSTRSFFVFQDTSSPTRSGRPSDISSSPITSTSPLVSLTLEGEKENVHPVTGVRATSVSEQPIKKRKTTVLVTKAHSVLSSGNKKHKDSKKPELKRKSSSSSASSKSGSGSAKVFGSSQRNMSSAPTRSLSDPFQAPAGLAIVDEEDMDAETFYDPQALIDSRCYELTVLPLGDVTQAYEQPPAMQENGQDSALSKSCVGRKKSFECQIRDYFSVDSTMPLPRTPVSTPTLGSEQFTTPERKEIYAAFTFASPSPTSERFSSAIAMSVDRFGDIEFQPEL